MKGIVFTEFLEMVEEKFGYEMVDEIIAEGEITAVMIHADGRPRRPIRELVKHLESYRWEGEV